MLVKMLEKREIIMSSGAKNIKQAGWEGEVSDEIGEDWVNEGAAEFIGGSGEGVAFTADEKLALKYVAAGVLQNAAPADMTLDDLDHEQRIELAGHYDIENAAQMAEPALYQALEQALEAEAEGTVDEDTDSSSDEDSDK